MTLNDKQIQALFGRVDELLERVTRIETRQYRMMKYMGIDPHNPPAPRPGQPVVKLASHE